MSLISPQNNIELKRDLRRIDNLISGLLIAENPANENAKINEPQRHKLYPHLLLLRDLIRSPFFGLIAEAYDQLYQCQRDDIIKTTSAGSFSAIDLANAFAKSTAVTFVSAESATHLRIIEIPKTSEGLGFNIMGGCEQNSPVFISRIIPGGVADRHAWPTLRRGDQLISVNGTNIERVSHGVAVRLLKSSCSDAGPSNASSVVRLVVRYTPKLLDELEGRFGQQQQRTDRYRHIHNLSSEQHRRSQQPATFDRQDHNERIPPSYAHSAQVTSKTLSAQQMVSLSSPLQPPSHTMPPLSQ